MPFSEAGQAEALCSDTGHIDLVPLAAGRWSVSSGARLCARIPGSEGGGSPAAPAVAEASSGGPTRRRLTSADRGAQRAVEGAQDSLGRPCGRGAKQGGSRRTNDWCIRGPRGCHSWNNEWRVRQESHEADAQRTVTGGMKGRRKVEPREVKCLARGHTAHLG